MQISTINQDGFQALDSNCPDSEQLHVFSGNLVRTIHLFSIPTLGRPLAFSLYHNSRNLSAAGDVGIGWRHNVQAQLRRGSPTLQTFIDETGRERDFEKVAAHWLLTSDSLYDQLTLTEEGEGRWTLQREPDGKVMEFQEQAGSPVVARLVRIVDGSDNAIHYDFNSSQELTAIREPISERAITIGWTSGRVTSVTDPEGNRFALSYTDDRLTTLEMPGGCLVEFGYDENHLIISRTDMSSASTLYTYDELARLTQIEGPLEDEERPTATWVYSSEPVLEVANLSPTSSASGEYINLTQVFFTTARGKTWEYRFLPSSMLWREISPLGHHRRYFYDDRQNLLYSSEGFPRKNIDDVNDTELDHPRDNINNMFRSSMWDEKGNLLASIDANGLVTVNTYGPNSRLLSTYPGQAHYGLGGNWRPHFCQEGSVFCAHQSDGSDLLNLPAYVSGVSQGSSVVPTNSGFGADHPALLSTQVLDAPERRVGQWTSETQSMDFQINLNEPRAFNLSLYTHSLDQLTGTDSVLDYPEFFGRDIEFTVTDLRGNQSFRVTQNASGVWVTFPVVGDETHPIQVTAVCSQSEHRPTLSALAFDPYEDRRTQRIYGPGGFLNKVTEPTSDPEREVADEYLYNSDGTTSQVSKVLRLAGELVDSRTSKMFYQDTAKNLTRIEDPLNQDEAPTLMEYDQNSNLVHLVDPDLKEMFFSFDYRRRLILVRNGLNQETNMTFDGRGLLTSVLDANSRETRLFYRPSRQLWKITNALDETTEFFYFPDGLLKSIKDAAGNEVFYEYSDDDQLIQVVYPETEVVLPDFNRVNLTPQLRLAYDVWERLVAVTSPNGNLDDLSTINLIGALNILRNGGAEFENGTRNQVPLGWEEGRPDGLLANSPRSSADSLAGGYSFPLNVPDTLSSGESYDWVQRRPGGFPGGRYVMKGSAKSDLATHFQLRAVVREFSGGLSEQTGALALGADSWTQASARVDLPGDAQVSQNMPALHQFRACIEKPDSGTANASLDELQVRALSQVSHYDGEYPSGSTGPDGARLRVIRDRFGRVRRIIDPSLRTVDFRLDVLGRILEVKDSQGLSLRYEWDFLGNLSKFIDSREKETVFLHDALSRVIQITQPDTDQFELFTYTAAGDLLTYRNCRGQERQFFYDDAHRLIQIDTLLTPDPTESVSLDYDEVGNLLTLTERNGDQLLMGYDEVNRLKTTRRTSATGSQWALSNEFDDRGHRTQLRKWAVYGMARYGQDRYGADARIFTAQFNARSQMESLKDGLENETSFGMDVDGRLAEVNHPTSGLQTCHRYDLVGKLLESRVTLASTELWSLSYQYNLAADRLRQTSGGNGFEYRLDSSGRLVQETLNRWVVNSVEAWATGRTQNTRFDLDAKLRLVGRADDFQAPYLDLQRWELAFTEPVATGVLVRQDQGLTWASSVGETFRNGRHMPPGTPYDSSNATNDYPHIDPQVSDTVGWLEGRILMRHRLPLEGEFDIEVAVSEFDLFECSIGLGITRERFESGDGDSRYPTTFGETVDANGSDIVLQKDGGLQARFNGTALSGVTATQLRLKRFLDDATWKLQAFYHDGSDWVTDGSWTADFSDQTVFAYLHLSGKVGHLRWTDFQDTVGPEFLVSAVDGDESVNQAAWPCYESQVYDAGHSVDWTRLAWNETKPTYTEVLFQLAVSDDPAGPWEYTGPSGSDSYFSTATGEALTDLTGRYCRFRAFLYSTDGLNTPELADVHLSHSGTSGSTLTEFSYDNAGNLLEITITDDSGTTTETRTVNDLNQIVTSTGGWEFLYDDNGCLIEKNNGTGVDDEKWEFSWDVDDRLVQVKKGVYAAGPVLVNEFTVDYSYDSMGRMMSRDDGTQVTTFVWDAWDLLSETTGGVTTEYLVPDGLIRSFLRDGDLYTLHTDGLGSCRLVTDESGAVVARFDYSAFGMLLDGSFDSVPGGMPFTWIGGLGVRTDSVTGLCWMRQRWFSAPLQRFISRDQLFAPNAYSYANNSPMVFVDLDGKAPTFSNGNPGDMADLNMLLGQGKAMAPEFFRNALSAKSNGVEIKIVRDANTTLGGAAGLSGRTTHELDVQDFMALWKAAGNSKVRKLITLALLYHELVEASAINKCPLKDKSEEIGRMDFEPGIARYYHKHFGTAIPAESGLLLKYTGFERTLSDAKTEPYEDSFKDYSDPTKTKFSLQWQQSKAPKKIVELQYQKGIQPLKVKFI